MIGPDGPNPLIAERQPLIPFMGCSVLFHIGALASAWLGGVAWSAVYGAMMLASFCQEPPKQSIEVELFAALPKSRLNVPDRAAAAPRSSGEPNAVKEPPPVKESDLVIHKEDPKVEGNTEDDRKRQEILDAIERNRLVEQLLNAPEGRVDRMQTDPNGVEGLDIAVLGASARGDPEYGRWMAKVQQLMMAHFRPITQGRTDLKCKLALQIEPSSGRILSWEIVTSSGDAGFDTSAESVPPAVGQIPLPPEKYLPLLAEPVNVTFVPPAQ